MTRQPFVSETTAEDRRSGQHEALRVIEFAIVESERLFIEVPEQMKRSAAHDRR